MTFCPCFAVNLSTSLPCLYAYFDQRLRLYPVQFYLIVVSGVSLRLGRQALDKP
jgi:hypothetical protein